MPMLLPFRALRPRGTAVQDVMAPPYDVVDTAKARQLAQGKPRSLLHVTRPEIDLGDEVAPDSDQVHRAGRAALESLVAQGVLQLESHPSFAVYRQVRTEPGDGGENTGEQVGIVACAKVGDYDSGAIRIHEKTRHDKETDRVNHIAALETHDEPVFLLAPPQDPGWKAVAELIEHYSAAEPTYDLSDHEGVRHTLWVIDDETHVTEIAAALSGIPTLYIADGHHRSAAAARVAAEHPDLAGAEVFPVVVFSGDDLTVLPYHRLVADLRDRTPQEFLAAVKEICTVTPSDIPVAPVAGEFGMYCDGQWYQLAFKPHSSFSSAVHQESDIIAQLDVSILQDRLLEPVLGVSDPRSDARISFLGGLDSLRRLQEAVDSGMQAVAFSLHPTSVTELVTISEAGGIMPPKSTWFDPKLASGLFLHPFGSWLE